MTTFDESRTYWLLRQQREKSWFAVKIKVTNDIPEIREVTMPHHDFHLVDKKFSLPASYAEYKDKQLFHVVSSSSTQQFAFESGSGIAFWNGATVEKVTFNELEDKTLFKNLPWEIAEIGSEPAFRTNARNQMSTSQPESVTDEQVETHQECGCEEEINYASEEKEAEQAHD